MRSGNDYGNFEAIFESVVEISGWHRRPWNLKVAGGNEKTQRSHVPQFASTAVIGAQPAAAPCHGDAVSPSVNCRQVVHLVGQIGQMGWAADSRMPCV